MSDIQTFFEGSNVFITGATGFIGKILLEKLLRGLPGIEKIYVLVRPKKGIEGQERLNKIFNLEIFDVLREKNPWFMEKVVPLSGDISKPGLGLSDADRATIINEVSVLIHAAATTKFNEPLSVAVPFNVNSVAEIVKLCREIKKLKVAVYVSTAFIQRDIGTIEEVVYPTPMNFEDINNTVQIIKNRNLSKEDEEQFTKILLGHYPNTYVFTKAIAEGIVSDAAKGLPFCIFRFPIAISTYKEPIPGWIDTMQGLALACVGSAVGVIRVILLPDLKATFHVVPADFVCNALIASAWETGVIKKGTPVYNFVNGKENPLVKGDFQKNALSFLPDYISNKALYIPNAFTVQSTAMFNFFDFFLHMLPALIGDVLLRILGKRPFLYKLYQKGKKLFEMTHFFALENWDINNKNIDSLWKKLSDVDKELFPFDLSTIIWRNVMLEYWKGMLKYVLKDDLSPEGRRKAIRKYYTLLVIHRTLQVVFGMFIIWILWKIF